jgi:hypothetical protein
MRGARLPASGCSRQHLRRNIHDHRRRFGPRSSLRRGQRRFPGDDTGKGKPEADRQSEDECEDSPHEGIIAACNRRVKCHG